MLTIPDAVWQRLLDVLAAAPPDHERVAYLDGVRYRDRTGTIHGIATTVTVPNAVTNRGNFSVSAEAMAEAGEHFAPLGLVRLAQVHTHGSSQVSHSWVDDRRSYSQRDGALSLVLPYHGTGHPTPWKAGIHLREPAGWRRITGHEIKDVIRLLPAVIDHRRTVWNASPIDTKVTSKGSCSRSRTPSRWSWPWSWRRRRRT